VSVDTKGRITAIAVGAVLVTASAGAALASTLVTVTADTTRLPPPVMEWDSVLQNVSIEGDVVVPVGEKWLIGPNVRIAGNLRTLGGTIGMRPGSSLHFIGADPDEYVGGGMGFSPVFARDLGIWVEGS